MTEVKVLPELNEDELVKRADAADAAALEDGKRTCYINTTLTLREVETAEQTFTVMGFVNALWRAPELEQEEGGATDRFSHREEGHDTVKDAMNKTISESQGRDYVSGFELNHDNAKATPFNPHRMFDHSRVIDRTLDKRKVTYYYYPMGGSNEGKPCAGLVKMAVEFEVTLTQKLNMRNFPFDRQLLQLGFFIRSREGWCVRSPLNTHARWIKAQRPDSLC